MRRARARLLSLLPIAPLVFAGGCVERTISVTSEPPGAIVYLNDMEVGRTPVETEFTFYGTYDVRLRLEGYEAVITSRDANAPIYDLPFIDLVAEAVPGTIESKVKWHFVLTPLPERVEGADLEALRQQVVQRAKELREQTPSPTQPPPPLEQD
jgi:hypothetical protein